MSLYRQVRRPSGWLTAAVVAALVVGFAIGFGVSRATADEPTFEDRLAELQTDARGVADALELVGLHYETSPAAAKGQLARAREQLAEIEPRLRLLAPVEAEAVDRTLQRLTFLVDARAADRLVLQTADRGRDEILAAARLR